MKITGKFEKINPLLALYIVFGLMAVGVIVALSFGPKRIFGKVDKK